MGWLEKLFGGSGAPVPRLTPFIEWRPGSYPTSVVGESNYQDALLRFCGGYSREGHELECEAQLAPEPSNPYDSNAVKVLIGGRLIGYLSREDAVDFAERMAEAGRDANARCAAKVRGGWRTNQHDQGHFGVNLAIPQRGPLVFRED